jgi:hypothetical protein
MRDSVGGENFRPVSRLGQERVSATGKEKGKPPRARVWGERKGVGDKGRGTVLVASISALSCA